jgi:streptogramin lyase
MRRSQTGFRPDQGRVAARARHRKLGLELLEERALMAAAVTEFPVLTAGSQPYGIVTGPDGNVWFTEASASNIGKIAPATGAVTEFPTLTGNSTPLGITAGPTGSNALYFTENSAGQIGKIDATTGAVTEFKIGTGVGPAPVGITLGSDGNIWFTDANPSGESIGKFDVGTQQITEYPLKNPQGAGLSGITTGPDGNIWFLEGTANKVGELDPADPTVMNEVNIPTQGASPFAITSGPDNNLWFTEQGVNQIGVVIPSTQTVNEYPIPTPGSIPQGITLGSDKNLWFTEQGANQIGRIDPNTGAIQEFTVPTVGAGLNGITSGPDSALWFAEGTASQIGRLSPTQIIQPTGTTITGSAGTAFSGVVASFTSADVNPQASDFSATIDWGDGTTTAATGIAPSNTGVGFNVAGTHTYATQNTYTVVVTISDVFGDTAPITSTANISGSVTPPVNGPIPTVTGLVRTGIHGAPTHITLSFSTALNPLQANNALNYSIIGLGPDNRIDTVGQVVAGHANDQYIHVLTAVYDATTNTVTLTTYEHLSVRELYQITVHSGPSVATPNGLTPDGLQSPLGVYLAGVDDTPGTDYVANFRGAFIPRPLRVRTRPGLHRHRFGRA